VLLEFYNYPAEHWYIWDHQPDRVAFGHRQVAAADHQGTRIQSRRHRDGVQTHRVRPAPLASRQRAPPGSVGPDRRDVREGELIERPDDQDGKEEVA